MDVKIGSDGLKYCSVTISGRVSPGDSFEPILTFAEIQGRPKAVRLDSIEFAIMEKMGFDLCWVTNDQPILIMPLESRGYFDFEKMQSIQSPPEAIGIGLQPFKCSDQGMGFLIMLDLVKC
jgi:hypothetical protein